MMIRNETTADVEAIAEVTEAAFKTLEISRHTEQFIIKALRAAGALTVSLVAEMDGEVVGHVAFSPVTIADGNLPALTLEGVPPEHFLALPFDDEPTRGAVTFHNAFFVQS